jgi:hypothetical protein
MPVRDDAQLPDKALPQAAPAAPAAEASDCSCADYRRDQVCDHVLMAAAVRMVRRMIDAHGEPEKPH